MTTRRSFLSRRLGARVAATSFAAQVVFFAASSQLAAQNPEDRGPLDVEMWNAGVVEAGGLRLRTRVYYPTTPGNYALVGVIHGANANGTYHPELASTLASRGMVAVVPDMPCTVWACDHVQNAQAVLALLDWAVAASAATDTPLTARVDGERRGLIGHSWGGLTSHLAAASDASIQSLVLLDPNDDGTEGRDATAPILAPTLQLLADSEASCNSAWREATVRERLTVPNLQTTIRGSGHCDPGELDVVCSLACGAGDSAKTAIFRRYAVAWTACNLLGDTTMQRWLGGAEYDADVADRVLTNAFAVRLDELPCASTTPDPDPDPDLVPDAGDADAGGADADTVDLDPDVDGEPADTSGDAAGDGLDTVELGGDDVPTGDDVSLDDVTPVGPSPPVDGTGSGEEGCNAASASTPGGSVWLVLGMLTPWLRRRRGRATTPSSPSAPKRRDV